MKVRKSASAMALGVAGLMAAPVIASGQTAAPPPPPQAAQETGALQEIVVTAQKRRENIQKVPISMIATTATAAKAAGVTGTLDIGEITPGLNVTKTGNAPILFMRGVGTALGGTPGDEGGVNIVVDGVVYTSLPGAIFSLNNIEQIEVLRGPQGTLFGRNATGGVVNITTRDPHFTPSGDFSLGYGDYNTYTGSAYVTGGLTKDIAADLALQLNDQNEGFGHNELTGRPVNLGRDFSVRSKVLWDVDPNTTIRLSADFDTSNSDLGIATRLLPGAVGDFGAVGPNNFYDTNANFDANSGLKTGGVSAKIEHEFDFAQLNSITAYRISDSFYTYDQDGSSVDLVDADFLNRENQFTQEVQLASLPSSKIKWITGIFYLDSDAKETPLTLSGLALYPAGFDKRYGDIGTSSIAGFAQTTIPIGDATNITGGVRYTSDTRHFTFSDISGLGIPLLPSANESKTFDKLTYRAAIDHALTKDLLIYASVSTGFKAGSFNIINPANPPILPESLTSYEAGFKSELFDHRLRLNASGFYYDYKNIQVSEIVSGNTLFLNAPGKLYGADVDFEAHPFKGFTLSGGFEALHSAYGDFPNAPASLPAPATCGPDGPVQLPGPPTGGNVLCAFNAQGKQLVRAPAFTSSVTAGYILPTPTGDYGLSVTYAHSTSFPWEIDNRLQQPPTDIVNGQLQWTRLDRNLSVRLWVHNLTNDHYYLAQSSSLNDTGAPAPPRTFGIAFDSHF